MQPQQKLRELPPFHSLHFSSIQALRGVAALLIVTEHIRFLGRGSFGVDIFFCISGFMIMFTTHHQMENRHMESKRSWKHLMSHFYLKRIIRLVPFYYAMTLITYCLLLLFPQMYEQTSPHISYLVKSLLFIPFDIGNGILQPLMRIGWTINCEMFFYLLFGIAMGINHRYRGLICSGFLLIPILLCRLLPVEWAPLTFYGDTFMLVFPLGILCYYAARGIYTLYTMDRIPKSVSYLCVLLCFVLLAYLILAKDYINVLGFYRLLLWSLPAFLIVITVFTAGLFLNTPTFAVKLGNISFSLYLIHYYPILFIDRVIYDLSQVSLASILVAILGIGLVILLAYGAWYFIENKFTGWLRVHLGKK